MAAVVSAGPVEREDRMKRKAPDTRFALNRTGRLLWIVLLAQIAFLLPVAGPALADDKPIHVDWLTYPDARDLSRRLQKPLLLYFTGSSCERCRKLDRETFTDAEVLNYLQEHFIAAQIDAREMPALSRKYKVDALPMIWFVDEHGRALTNLTDFVTAERLTSVMKYVITGAWRTITWQEWLEGRRPSPDEAAEDAPDSGPGTPNDFSIDE